MQPTVKTHPIGAIKSIAHLQSIIDERANTELFYVHGLGKASILGENHFITNLTYIEGRRLINIRWHDFDTYSFSLLDCNVCELNCYNEHFLFDNRRLAERYLAECKANAIQEISQQEHLRWCNRLFNDWR